MRKDSDDLSRKQQRFSKRQAIVGGCVLLLVLTLLGFFAVVRPVIVMVPEGPSVDVKNEGGMTALIYKVDGFWYWGGQVAFLGNIYEEHRDPNQMTRFLGIDLTVRSHDERTGTYIRPRKD